MARVTVNNDGNIFFKQGEFNVTIADLAALLPILKRHSNTLNIYEVQAAFEADWKHEIAEWEYEYATGYTARFKDGSAISVGAWADADPADYGYN
jgi:hypothetical protein